MDQVAVVPIKLDSDCVLTIVMMTKSLSCAIPSFHLFKCVFVPETSPSPCGPNTRGAAPYAAPLWHCSEINKQKNMCDTFYRKKTNKKNCPHWLTASWLGSVTWRCVACKAPRGSRLLASATSSAMRCPASAIQLPSKVQG